MNDVYVLCCREQMLRLFRGHTWETWEWDPDSKSPDAHLSLCRQAVYFHVSPLLDSQGTAGVRGSKGETTERFLMFFVVPKYYRIKVQCYI